MTFDEKEIREHLDKMVKNSVLSTVDERRLEMLTLRALHVPAHQITKTICSKYNTNRRQIYSDWSRRKTWAPKLLNIQDGEALVIDLNVFAKWLQKRAVLEILQGNKSSDRVRAIKAAVETLRLIFDIAKDTGKIPMVSEKIELDVRKSSQKKDSGEIEQLLARLYGPKSDQTTNFQE